MKKEKRMKNEKKEEKKKDWRIKADGGGMTKKKCQGLLIKMSHPISLFCSRDKKLGGSSYMRFNKTVCSKTFSKRTCYRKRGLNHKEISVSVFYGSGPPMTFGLYQSVDDFDF